MNPDNFTKIKIDGNLLEEIGLGSLPKESKTCCLKGIYEEPEARVGRTLSGCLTNDQIDEFASCFEEGDDERTLALLESSIPFYRDVIREEFEALKFEIAVRAEDILASVKRGIA